MKISELIQHLEKVKEEHGDLNIYQWDYEINELLNCEWRKANPVNVYTQLIVIDGEIEGRRKAFRYDDERPNYPDFYALEEKAIVL